MDSFKEHLKSSVDIVEVVGERVRLKRSGQTYRYAGLCPFHTEKTPSFSVNQKLQIYICFGCGAKGDVFKFVMEMNSVTFPEAMKILAERYGIPMPQRSEYADRESRIREALYRMNEIALSLFRKNLNSQSGTEARDYVKERGVSPETAEEFGIGLADRTGSSMLQALRKEGFSDEFLEESGLVLKRQEGGGYFDRFRNRLIFPIHNESGKVAGFGGRALVKGDEPKYLNSPETAVYKKSRILYNLNRSKDSARKEGRFVLLEGYMDVIGLHAAGVTEVVASCGTALTQDQVRLMKRFADHVIVNFDPDAGGSRGAERSIEILLNESVRVRILELAEDVDPDEYVLAHGSEAYQTLLTRAPSYYFWLADQLRKRNEKTAQGRAKVLQQLLPAIMRIPDKIERAAIADDLAGFIGVDKGMLLDQFKKAAADRREQRIEVKTTDVRSVERILLSAVIHHPEMRPELIPELRENPAIAQFQTREIWEAIFGLYLSQPEFHYEDLEGRLGETEQTLLSRIVFADEIHETDNLDSVRENSMSCLRVLTQEQQGLELDDLRRRIKEAEQRGEFDSALKLMQELDQWKMRGTGKQTR